jgi:4-amino-4-deoxy-L-arabinose transferase-like glycosyltransferase
MENDPMRRTALHQLSIVAIGLLVFFSGLGATRLWDQDEAFFGRAAVEMHQRGEWVVPYFNGEVFAHKPPFMFWMMRMGFFIFGVGEFAARFWSAVFAIGTAVLTYRLGRRLFNETVGLIAALALETTLMFDIVARAATPDSYLVFFCTLALFLFARWEWKDGNATASHAGSLPWLLCVTMYAAMAMAVLVKGPIGIVLPGATIGLYLLVSDDPFSLPADASCTDRMFGFVRRFSPARVARAFWSMRPFTAIACLLAVAGPWFALVGWRTNGEFLREFFGTHNFGRFTNAMDNHGGGVWYYIPAILVGFFPWSIFAVPSGINVLRAARSEGSPSRSSRLLLCWITAFVGFFSIASTKLPNYVLPAYPALALATAALVERWLTRPATVHRWWPRLSFGSMVLVGACIAIAVPIIAQTGSRSIWNRLGLAAELRGDFLLLAWIGGGLAIGGATCLLLASLARRHAALATLIVSSMAFCVALLSGLATRIDRHQPIPALASGIHRDAAGPPHVAQFAYFRPSLVYYCDSRIEACKTPAAVAEFLTAEGASYVVTSDEHYAKIKALLPADVEVLARFAEFPRAGSVVVLGKKTSLADRDKGRDRGMILDTF